MVLMGRGSLQEHVMRLRIWLLGILLACANCPSLYSQEDEKAREILMRCSAALREIKTLQCDTSRVYVREVGGEKVRSADAVRLLLSGDKCRAEYFNNIATPKGEPNFIQAFDGSRFFQYLKDADSLAIDSQRGPDNLSPATYDAAFHWLYEKQASRTWAGSLDKGTWEAAAKRAHIVEPMKDRDWECEVLEFKAQSTPTVLLTYRVCLAKDLEFFPTKCDTLKDGEVIATRTLEKHSKTKVGDQTLIVPLEVRHRQFKILVQEADYYLAEETLRINQPIDEKQFTLPKDDGSNVLEK